ncbi:15627_t:CDS:2 [Funneliformis geosporum]|uniref:4219_t:CDS:1 n=1 Tax=Funneliformis geosporum TaxID=1117311 RepID=A0A9W4SP58_9GLOM|nr:15627_t:CDS:2 [Funneliformis geosporum]CAI2176542.1 4219_t:CDS:2 [Funneliformis geosporum]
MNQNNQDLIKLIQDGQKTQRWTMVKDVIGSIAGLATMGRIDKLKSRHQAEMARAILELDIIEREAKHEAELRELEVGLEKKEETEMIAETDNFINKLKNKGQTIFHKKVGAVKEQFNQIKDKIPNPLDDQEK